MTSYIKGDKMTNPRGQAARDAKRKWAAKHPEYKSSRWSKEQAASRRAQIEAAINTCYLKEARAMLEGKDTKGKNKCCPLPGD